MKKLHEIKEDKTMSVISYQLDASLNVTSYVAKRGEEQFYAVWRPEFNLYIES